MTEPMKDAPRGVMNEPTQEFIEGSERRSITELIRENWTMRTEIASLRAGLHEKEGELQRAQQAHATLQQCIESWKKEELVWRQSDHEHRVKQQQMQAGAEQLCAELDLLHKRKDYHAEYMEVMAEVVQVRRERDAWKSASGLESPEELSTMLDTQPLLPDQLTNALSDLAEQGQNLDLAEAWQKRAEASESREKRVREALEKIANEHGCGCVPCVGQCGSQEALQITLDEIRTGAREALKEESK